MLCYPIAPADVSHAIIIEKLESTINSIKKHVIHQLIDENLTTNLFFPGLNFWELCISFHAGLFKNLQE
jgi:hypothetical protein